MATQQQILANRENAKKSAGPRTTSGKTVSRRNALKHGLTAKTLLLEGESATEFETFREGLYREHDPQTASQCQLVEIIASHFWRLRRTPGFEARLLNRHTGSSENQQAKRLIFLGWNDVPGGPDPDLPGALDPARDGTTPVQPEKEDCPDDPEQSERVRVIQFGQKSEPSEAPAYSRLETIDRHETSLINGLIKALHLLSVLQSRR